MKSCQSDTQQVNNTSKLMRHCFTSSTSYIEARNIPQNLEFRQIIQTNFSFHIYQHLQLTDTVEMQQ